MYAISYRLVTGNLTTAPTKIIWNSNTYVAPIWWFSSEQAKNK